MNLGFTGTQNGMKPKQLAAMRELIEWYAKNYEGIHWHDGDCIGADDQAHKIAEANDYYTVGHPPKNSTKRARNKFVSLWDPKDYLKRNDDIVYVADVLLAAPGTMEEQVRSGTWSTIRKARKKLIPIYIVLPDGSIQEENTFNG